MRKARHAHACGIELVEIGDIAFEAVQSFGAEQPTNRAFASLAVFKQIIDILSGPDSEQLPF